MNSEARISIEGSIREGQRALDREGHAVCVTLIRGDTSKNGYGYSEEVLQALVPMVEGAHAYADHSGADLYTLSSQTTGTSADSGSLDVSKYREVLVLVNVTALTGTTPTITFFVETLGSDGVWYPLYSPAAINAASTIQRGIGGGQSSNISPGATLRLRWTIGGTASPTVTFSASILAK